MFKKILVLLSFLTICSCTTTVSSEKTMSKEWQDAVLEATK
jgi:hypothetical protein